MTTISLISRFILVFLPQRSNLVKFFLLSNSGFSKSIESPANLSIDVSSLFIQSHNPTDPEITTNLELVFEITR